MFAVYWVEKFVGHTELEGSLTTKRMKTRDVKERGKEEPRSAGAQTKFSPWGGRKTQEMKEK